MQRRDGYGPAVGRHDDTTHSCHTHATQVLLTVFLREGILYNARGFSPPVSVGQPCFAAWAELSVPPALRIRGF